MMGRNRNAAGIAASVLLAGLTVAVFAQFQQSGPQGVMMRFLEEIAGKDGQGAMALTTGQPTGSESVILNSLYSRLQSGARYRVIEVRRMADVPVARVRVTFYYPNAEEPTEWMVVRENHVWRIDLRATMIMWGQAESR